MRSTTPSKKYPSFEPDFFNDRLCRILFDIGETVLPRQLTNISVTTRHLWEARQAIFQRYLRAEDIAMAGWIYSTDTRQHPYWRHIKTGMDHLDALLETRSNGQYKDEIIALAKALPAPPGFAKNKHGNLIVAIDARTPAAMPSRPCLVVIRGGSLAAARPCR